MQTPIPSLFMRGGTSRGVLFPTSGQPVDIATCEAFGEGRADVSGLNGGRAP